MAFFKVRGHSLQLLGSINLVQCGYAQASGALWWGPSTWHSRRGSRALALGLEVGELR